MEKIPRGAVLPCWYELSIFVAWQIAFAILYGRTWPARLEAAASQTIELPSKIHEVVELTGRNDHSEFIVDLAMSAPVTVVVHVWNDETQLVAVRAATGPVCEGPLAFRKHVFVDVGLFDHCLTRQETSKPSDALVLRLNRDHGLDSVWAGWIHYSWDYSGQLGHDQAWQFELHELISGQETLLGRGIATEFISEDNKPLPQYWPDLPEIQQRQQALRKRRAELYQRKPLVGIERWRFRESGWIDEFHSTPSNLSYAMLARSLDVEFDSSWLKTGRKTRTTSIRYSPLVRSGSRKPKNGFHGFSFASVAASRVRLFAR